MLPLPKMATAGGAAMATAAAMAAVVAEAAGTLATAAMTGDRTGATMAAGAAGAVEATMTVRDGDAAGAATMPGPLRMRAGAAPPPTMPARPSPKGGPWP